MAKAVKLFLGRSYNPDQTQWVAQSEHGSWWSRTTTESGKTVDAWGATPEPQPPTYEAKYEARGGRWVCVRTQPLSKRVRLARGSIQGNANPLMPVFDAASLASIRLPLSKTEQRVLEEAKALKDATKQVRATRRPSSAHKRRSDFRA